MTITTSRTDERITQPDFEAFYLRTSRTLHGYLSRLTRDPATAEELLQEAYIRMINLPAMDELPRKAYLYKTATNILRDRWRKQKREQKWSELTQGSEAIHPNLSLPLDMASVLDQLSPQERAVLWLAHVEELSHREIAAVLDVKENSVKVIVFRARGKAKELLEKAGLGVCP
ncbi:MAG TPA: RNA polymerase sigma factor [Terriglobales bacterium]